jgi:hypothetical protein
MDKTLSCDCGTRAALKTIEEVSRTSMVGPSLTGANGADAVHMQPQRSSPDFELTSLCWETQKQIGSVHSTDEIMEACLKGGRSVQRLAEQPCRIEACRSSALGSGDMGIDGRAAWH